MHNCSIYNTEALVKIIIFPAMYTTSSAWFLEVAQHQLVSVKSHFDLTDPCVPGVF